MANLNKVLLIGRLTRDPEVKTFGSGAKLTTFGFAVNNRKKNAQTGTWEDEPVWLDCKGWHSDNGFAPGARLGELKKGAQIYIEGRLHLEQWEKDGEKRQKLSIVVDNFQYLDPLKRDGSQANTSAQRQPEPQHAMADEDIPF